MPSGGPKTTHTPFGHPFSKNGLDTLYHSFLRIWPYLIFLPVAYFLGRAKLHLPWFLAFFFLAWSMINRFRTERKETLEKEFLLPKPTPIEPGKESCNWFTIYLYHIWPHCSLFLADILKKYTEETISSLIENYSFVSVKIQHCSMGKTPVMFTNMEAFDNIHHVYRVDTDLTYDGDMEIEFEISVGHRLVKWHIPLTVKNVFVLGRVRFEFWMTTRFPFVYRIDSSFKSPPRELTFELDFFGFDILSIPVLNYYLKEAIVHKILAKKFTLPNVNSFYLNLFPEPGINNPYCVPGLFDPYDVENNIPMDANPEMGPPVRPVFANGHKNLVNVLKDKLEKDKKHKEKEKVKEKKKHHENQFVDLIPDYVSAPPTPVKKEETGQSQLQGQSQPQPQVPPPQPQHQGLAQGGQSQGQGQVGVASPRSRKDTSPHPEILRSDSGSMEWVARPFPERLRSEPFTRAQTTPNFGTLYPNPASPPNPTVPPLPPMDPHPASPRNPNSRAPQEPVSPRQQLGRAYKELPELPPRSPNPSPASPRQQVAQPPVPGYQSQMLPATFFLPLDRIEEKHAKEGEKKI
eukprot:TRINITY_DN4711_c0_g2_i1.p1 TRINITY_DN4711_c0_g2~~TRINITY_DN4711_c0_g2_i1.p1  ORF type:complete len:575 (-),score=97.01 TRINITY_DN4711_c0_g2_i1:30-1754(-)